MKVVEGYVLEGHVPAADVKRLLAAKPFEPFVGQRRKMRIKGRPEPLHNIR